MKEKDEKENKKSAVVFRQKRTTAKNTINAYQCFIVHMLSRYFDMRNDYFSGGGWHLCQMMTMRC